MDATECKSAEEVLGATARLLHHIGWFGNVLVLSRESSIKIEE